MAKLDHSRDTKNTLDWNDHQFFNPFDLHHDEGIFLHAAVGDIDDLSREEVIAVQGEQHLGGIRMVDIANFELDPLVFHIYALCPSSPQVLLSELLRTLAQEACHGAGERLLLPILLMGRGLRRPQDWAVHHPRGANRKEVSDGALHPSGKGVPPPAYGHSIRRQTGDGQAVLTRLLGFVQLVVDAAGDPKQLSRVRLIAMRSVQCSLE